MNECMNTGMQEVRSWKEVEGDDFVVIGGYESGMDAAYNLASTGKRCSVLSSTPYWSFATDDPSTELAPYTVRIDRQTDRQTDRQGGACLWGQFTSPAYLLAQLV